MRLRVVPLVLALVPLAVAAEQAWPGKGDTVYVSASFKKLSAASPVAGAQMQYDMPPCAALVITKANPKKSLWVTKDPVGGTEHLEGAWLARMHKTKAECEAQHSQDGEPDVVRSGNTFKLVPGESR
jgi:hypothetical protein